MGGRTGRTLFVSLGYTPRWANGNRPYNYPPLYDQDWYDFVYAVVARYRADVSLWGIWNEPNLDIYLRDSDVRTYQMLVTTAASAVRAADPAGRVRGPEVSHHAFRDGWYLAAMRSVGDLFDIVTVHWYPDGPDLGFMMDQLVRPFAGGKPIWLTESGMKPCESVLAETGQAALYNKVFKAFLPRRGWWTGLMFYDLYDPPEPMDCGSGILRPDYSNRPAFLLCRRSFEGIGSAACYTLVGRFSPESTILYAVGGFPHWKPQLKKGVLCGQRPRRLTSARPNLCMQARSQKVE